MELSQKRRLTLRLCALVAVSVGLLIPVGGAQASAPGTVAAWGCTAADGGECTVPGDLAGNVTAVAAGYFHSLALRTEGTVAAFGCPSFSDWGQCNVPGGLSDVSAIAAGYYHSLALKGDGTVVAWGCGGFADFLQCNVPSGLSDVTAISAGETHSLALKSDGTVVAWGCLNGGAGQCNIPFDLSGVVAVSASRFQSLALKSDGTVVAWGCNGGAEAGQCSVPSGLSGVTAIAAGPYHNLALKNDGTVVAWGCGMPQLDAGQCNVPSGLSGVVAIAAADYHSLALKSDGTVVAWGCGSGFDSGQCNVPSGLSGVEAISAGTWHSLALIAAPPNRPPDCSAVGASPDTLGQMRDQLALVTLAGATDPDGDTLSYRIDGVSQDEYVTGVGDDTSPDAALTSAGADSNRVLLRAEANPRFNGRVYRIAYTVSDGHGGSCSGTAGRSGTTTAKVGVPRKKGAAAVDDGISASWNSFTGAPVQ